MSIEKLDFQKVSREQIPYTLIITKVIQKIKDALSGFIWIYLSSLPPDWKVNKEHIKNKFEIGDNRIKAIFSYLKRSQLIEYKRERFEDGTLGEVTVHVLCGDNFNADECYVLSTGLKTIPVDLTTGSKTRRVENQTSGSRALQKKHKNKVNKKEEKKEKAEREQKSKTTLSASFYPDAESFKLIEKRGIDRDSAQTYYINFMEYFLDSGETSDNWQRRFRMWIIRERA